MLSAIDAGNPKAAEELLPLVYEELRRLAAAKMAREQSGQTLQPTALVHEAWLYALGVLLYELLTGQTPFDGKDLMARGIDAMRRTIREKEPPKPSTRLTKELVAVETTQRKATEGLTVPTQEELEANKRRRHRLKEQIALLRGDSNGVVMLW